MQLASLAFAIAVAGAAVSGGGPARAQDKPQPKKPELILRANPVVGFAPAKVQFTAILQGGDDDYEEYYCPTIEWDWDDETVSESSPDCEPYTPGKRISRRYSATHTFHFEGHYEVRFKLKRQKKVIAVVTTHVTIRSG
jgi:hypothetical protein